MEQKPKAVKKSKQSLTLKQARLVKALVTSDSVSEAGKKAGYAYRQDAHQALKGIAERAPEVLERLGLTIEHVSDKYLRPLLEAKRKEFFQNGGIVMQEKEVEDNGTRIRAIEVWAKLMGAYTAQKVQLSGDVSLDLNHVTDDDLDRTIANLLKPSQPTSTD